MIAMSSFSTGGISRAMKSLIKIFYSNIGSLSCVVILARDCSSQRRGKKDAPMAC